MSTRHRWILAAVLVVVAALAVSAAVLKYEPIREGSNVTFHAHSTGHDFQGTTAAVTGQFGADRANVAGTAYGDFRIPVATLKTGITARDNKMYDLFETAKFPNIVFHLTSMSNVRWSGSDTFTAQAAGDLTVHGVTKPGVLQVNCVMAGNRLTVKGTADVKITDFGMEPPGILFIRVADNVRISFTVKADPVRG